MGDRVSIQFQKGEEKSVVLFSHWDGMDFVEAAEEYVECLKKEVASMKGGNQCYYPIHRFEPDTVMVDFIVQYIGKPAIYKSERVNSNYYLAVDEEHGDNSDNGHHIISLD